MFELKKMYEIIKLRELNKEHTLESSDIAKKYFCNYFADKADKENFVAAFLNNMHDVITTKIISTGSLNSSAVHPREIIKEALFCNANSVIVAHNHPSGSLSPSVSDLDSTRELRKCFDATGVTLLDHIIVAGDKAISLADTGNIHHSKIQLNIPKTASPTAEMVVMYKPARNKEQLAMAEHHITVDALKKSQNIKSIDRRSR